MLSGAVYLNVSDVSLANQLNDWASVLMYKTVKY